MCVTAILWTYIPYIIHQSYQHPIGLTQLATKCSNRTKMITSCVINLYNTFTCN